MTNMTPSREIKVHVTPLQDTDFTDQHSAEEDRL